MADVVAARRAEQRRLIELARSYVDRLSARLPVLAAAVVGSVARGDFNVWSDIDVVVVCHDLPDRAPDRMAALMPEDTRGVQPVGFTPDEFRKAWSRGNPLATSVIEEGVIVRGDEVFSELSSRSP